MNEIILTFNGKKQSVKIADDPATILDYNNKLALFSNDASSYWNDSSGQNDKFYDFSIKLVKSIAFFWSLTYKEISQIYWSKDFASDEIFNLMKSKEIFKQGTVDRKIAIELIQNKEFYDKQMKERIGIDADGFPYFNEIKPEKTEDKTALL